MPVNSMYVYAPFEVPPSNEMFNKMGLALLHARASHGEPFASQAGNICQTNDLGCSGHGTVAPGDNRISDEIRDDVLLRQAAKGDEDAFTTLYRRHQAAIYRFALRMTGNAWASEEIVQDVFMTLMREPKKYDPERGALAAYLYGIARNRVMKHLERLPREVQLDDSSESGLHATPGLTNVVTPMHWAERQERTEQVRAAVSDLPPEFREAVVLCELEELSYEEASQRIGCPIGTIRSRLHRGRALLLAKLEILRDVPRRFSAAR